MHISFITKKIKKFINYKHESLLGKEVSITAAQNSTHKQKLVWLLAVLRDHSFFSSRHNEQWPLTSKDFLCQLLSSTLFFYLNS